MGIYLNPGNDGFKRIISGEYVDKTTLIDEMNSRIGKSTNLVCLSRPRRFGKSYTAQMLCAYYDCSCDSADLFDGYSISKSTSYKEHINKYNVIYIDITSFLSELNADREKTIEDAPDAIISTIRDDIISEKPELDSCATTRECMLNYCELTGRRFVFIIDEWDAIIREARNNADVQMRYINILRGWFKNGNFTPKAVAAAYMTGILPIKKDGTESTISDFREYTILNPGRLIGFTGFNEDEVKELCKRHGMDFDKMRGWYDGYHFEKTGSVYNPYSVMLAIENGVYASYWKSTTAANALFSYVDMNYEGLQDDVLRLITGEEIEVDTNGFNNDVENFNSKDDVLTLLIHLGYLAYDREKGTVRIPNKEVYGEFEDLLKKPGKNKLYQLIRESDILLKETLACNEKYVSDAIDRIRMSDYAPTFYNNEQALRYVIKFAYITCVDKYLKIQELPSGRGIADVAFIPKRNTANPAMIVELKWNKADNAAIDQIRKKEYPEVLKEYGGDIVIVGITYDDKSKTHDCKIEMIAK